RRGTSYLRCLTMLSMSSSIRLDLFLGDLMEAVCRAPDSPMILGTGRAVPGDIQAVTVKTRDAAIELLVQFFREQGGGSHAKGRRIQVAGRGDAQGLALSA